MAVGAVGGYLFPPVGILILVGLFLYWRSTWKILSTKCSQCGYKIGRLNSLSNRSCRNCNKVYFEEAPKSEGNDEFWDNQIR